MENENKHEAIKTVLLIFGIIFSIVLVPGLILGIPVGGATVALSQSVSQESIEESLKKAKLSEKLYAVLMDEVASEAMVEELNPEYWDSLLRESITVEFVDNLILAGIDSMYNGTVPDFDVSEVMDGFQRGISDITEDGVDDIFSACFDGTESKYFSEEFIQSVRDEFESEVLGEYPEYGVTTLEELEDAYDEKFGAGSFDKLFEEELAKAKAEWDTDFVDELLGELDDIEADLKLELEDILRELEQDPDVRETFDVLKGISEKKDTVKLVAYGIVLAAVLLLLVLYWFGTAGFVVPSVALILGGLFCKLLTLLEDPLMGLIRDELMLDSNMKEIETAVMDLFAGFISPFFAEMSKFGFTMIGLGVLLILLAILRGVLKKNMHPSEEMM